MGNYVVFYVDCEKKPKPSEFGEWKESNEFSPKGSKFKLNTDVKWEGDIDTLNSKLAGYILENFFDTVVYNIWYERDTSDHEESLPLNTDEILYLIIAAEKK